MSKQSQIALTVFSLVGMGGVSLVAIAITLKGSKPEPCEHVCPKINLSNYVTFDELDKGWLHKPEKPKVK